MRGSKTLSSRKRHKKFTNDSKVKKRYPYKRHYLKENQKNDILVLEQHKTL